MQKNQSRWRRSEKIGSCLQRHHQGARPYHVVTPLLLTFDHRELLLCRGTLLAVDWTANQETYDASLVLYLQLTLEFLLQIDFYP